MTAIARNLSPFRQNKPAKPLSLKKALEFMARGSCLMNQGGTYYVVPGGSVDPNTARVIMNRPDVRGAADCLWPGLDQTWRMS
jgi:hypothetical protein